MKRAVLSDGSAVMQIRVPFALDSPSSLPFKAGLWNPAWYGFRGESQRGLLPCTDSHKEWTDESDPVIRHGGGCVNTTFNMSQKLRAGHRLPGASGMVALFASSLLSALFWWGEEESKFWSVGCSMSVAAIAVAMVRLAQRRNSVKDADLWFSLIGVRILAATLLVGAFWYEPDLSHRHSVMQPDLLGFDPVRWDEMGEQFANDGLLKGEKAIHRFGKEGLIYYTAGIYTIFGVSCVYIAWFNVVIATATLLLLAHWLRARFGTSGRWDLMAWGLLVPEYLWYGSLVLKEVHNGFLFVLFLVCFTGLLARTSAMRSRLMWITGMLIALLGIAVFHRAHIVTMVVFALAAIAGASGAGNRARAFLLFCGAIAFVAALEFRMASTDTDLVSSENDSVADSVFKASEEAASDNSINTMLIGGSFGEKLLFTVPRTVFLAVTPFPRLEVWSPWTTLDSDWLAMCQTASRLSVILLLILLPALVAVGARAFTDPAMRIARLPVFMYVIGLVAIANGAMMFHERWRSSLWPIWLALILIGWPDRRAFYWTLPACAAGGAIVFLALKTI